jgi:Ferritin-like domain
VNKKLNHFVYKALSRRKFIASGSTAAATAVFLGCKDNTPAPSVSAGTSAAAVPSGITDNDIMNFALNLEYLEAEFYLYAATGKGMSAADALSGAGTTKVPQNIAAVSFGSSKPGVMAMHFANELAQTELNHVRFLQKAIIANQGTPVPRPDIDLTFFGPLAMAAGISSSTSANPYNPYSTLDNFLLGSFIFEDVGVTAFAGAAPKITDTNVLSAAAGLQAAEAYHAGAIRTILVATAAAAKDQTLVDNANLVSKLRAALGGGNETPLSTTSIVVADAETAVGFSRTPDQVLHIVYGAAGGAGLAKGGFYPNGLNGNVKVTAS